MHPFVQNLRKALELRATPKNAAQQKAYMRNQYEFFGLKAPEQAELRREFLKTHGLAPTDELRTIIRELWQQPEREFQYFGMMILEKYIKKVDADFISLLEFMISTKSWWDTVDMIAARLVGVHFKIFPGQIPVYTEKWMASGNFWLQRTALLFQLKYKKDTDTGLLFNLVERLADEDEFFIRKAIGWALREYSKTDPEAVISFVESHELKPLSRKEALRVVERKKQIN